MNHFIDTSSVDLSRARTTGLTNLLPQPFPVLIAGRKSTHGFFFANSGTLETWSGDPDYGLRLTIGDAVSRPIASDFSLSVDGGSTLTLPWEIDAVGLQNALNDEAVVAGEGGVLVFGIPGHFLIAYKTVGAKADLSVSVPVLVPDCTGVLSVLTTGAVSTRQLVSLDLRQTTPLQTTTFAVTASPYAGWTGTIDLSGSLIAQFMREKAKEAGAYLEAQSLLTLEVIDADGISTPYYQTPILIRALNYPVSVTQNTPSLPLTSGPTRHSTSSAIAGNIAVTPLSNIHTEVITFTGSANTRNIVVGNSGLDAGAIVDLLCIFDGVADGVVLNIYAVSLSGTLLYTFTKAGGEANALFNLVASASSFDQVNQVIPAYN